MGLAGLAIGLTLIAIHLLGINVTGTSVNPSAFAWARHRRCCHQPDRAGAGLAVHRGATGRCGHRQLLFNSGILAGDDVIPERGGGKSDVPPAASAPRKQP